MLAYVRINPLFPSPPLNYMYGLTSIGLVKYTLVSMFSVAPVVYVFSFLGNVFSITNEADEAVFKVSVFLFLVTSVLAVLFKSYKKYYE